MPGQRGTLVERTWAKIDHHDEPGCWLWLAGRNAAGYGKIGAGSGGSHLYAHRVAWFLASGHWPTSEEVVAHVCNNPPCVRHDGPLGTFEVDGVAYPRYGHLFLTTYAGNNAHTRTQGRNSTGDQHGLRKHPGSAAHGERHWHTQFTTADVIAIRQRYAAGESIAALARAYKVYPSAIWKIVHRKRWQHVA